jgi:hypothetical protein
MDIVCDFLFICNFWRLEMVVLLMFHAYFVRRFCYDSLLAFLFILLGLLICGFLAYRRLARYSVDKAVSIFLPVPPCDPSNSRRPRDPACSPALCGYPWLVVQFKLFFFWMFKLNLFSFQLVIFLPLNQKIWKVVWRNRELMFWFCFECGLILLKRSF